MKLNGTLLKSTVIAALVAAPMAPVMAQTAETDGATEQTAPATEAANFSEAELSSFIDAAMQVQAVQQDYMTRIQETEADEDKQALVQEAQAEMTNAVKETDGMDLETYNEIGQAAQSDPELNQRILAMVQTRQGENGEAETKTE
ncbi:MULTISPECIES: DUF4168 domain-containing protein [Salipiger]|jgi:hypothetical protein|uniref:DUF4168 domain-containing protein n=1 Tax=Salipiger profundus TaxID=1229727 RepID=A0A1U7DC63_9RHOB|nr:MULTISPECIES: DUF4168 domain-containing protein [Salipiger]APX25650.1 protein of unknown function (DUF4168) [Salipiger profundus]GGA04235.1 hypothetical protein GCM10011326_14750 [Salipiger profundus]SFD54261.1 protein of unknown function [Salipiger profundus]